MWRKGCVRTSAISDEIMRTREARGWFLCELDYRRGGGGGTPFDLPRPPPARAAALGRAHPCREKQHHGCEQHCYWARRWRLLGAASFQLVL